MKIFCEDDVCVAPDKDTFQWRLFDSTMPNIQSRGSFPGHEADHSPPLSAEVDNACSCTSTPSICNQDVLN